MDMKAGDLLHIPQAVVLWNPTALQDSTAKRSAEAYIQTDKPCTGIYLGTATVLDRDHIINVFVKGQQHFVHSKDVYPIGE